MRKLKGQKKKTRISRQKTRICSRFLHTVKTSFLRLAPSIDDFAPNVRPQTEIKLHFRGLSPSWKVSLLKVANILQSKPRPEKFKHKSNENNELNATCKNHAISTRSTRIGDDLFPQQIKGLNMKSVLTVCCSVGRGWTRSTNVLSNLLPNQNCYFYTS